MSLSITSATDSNTSSTWIGDARFDLFFFFGGGGVALLLGLIVITAPSTVFPLWLLWLCFVEGPHLFGTWQRTYFDARIRREQSALLWWSLLWFVPAPFLLAVSYLSGQIWLFQLILGFAALWSFHHLIRQHHGILAIYQRLNHTSLQAQKQDKYLLHSSIWLAFALFLLHNPLNRQVLQLPAPTALEIQLHLVLAVALVTVSVFWAGLLWRRYTVGASLKPGLFALCIALATTLFAVFVVGNFEPLLINARTPEQMFMATTMVNGTLHGVQYIGIVIASSRRRAEFAQTQTNHSATFASRLGLSPVWAYSFLALLSVPYVGLNIIRGGAPIGSEMGSMMEQFFLAMFWGLFFHHYWLDQKIWKPSHDSGLRAELGIR
jgi:hypothetical protein